MKNKIFEKMKINKENEIARIEELENLKELIRNEKLKESE